MMTSMIFTACGARESEDGKIEIELVQYKPEAVEVFQQLEEEFNRW